MFDIFANWGMQNPDERKKSLEEIARGSQYGTGLQNKSDFKDSSSLVSRYNLRGRQNPNVVPMQKKQSIYPDAITTGGQGTQQGDIGFLQRLSNLAGVDMDKAAAMWKDKGGFEGLMSNPAFTMGLAFMQAGANGKTLGQDALNNVVKAAGISAEFKDRIAARKQAPIQATAGDIAEVKDLLQTMKIDEPNMWEKAFGWIKGDNVTAKYDEAAEQIAVEYQKKLQYFKKIINRVNHLLLIHL